MRSSHSYADRCAHSHPGADSNGQPYPSPYGNAYSHSNPNCYPVANCYPVVAQCSNADTPSYGHGNADCDTNTNSYLDSYSLAYSDSYSRGWAVDIQER